MRLSVLAVKTDKPKAQSPQQSTKLKMDFTKDVFTNMNLNGLIIKGLLKLIFVFLLLLLLLKKSIILKRDYYTVLDQVVKVFFKYISILTVFLFITIQLHIYDAIFVNFLLLLVIIYSYFTEKNITFSKEHGFRINSKMAIIGVKYFERGFIGKKLHKNILKTVFRKKHIESFYSLILLLLLAVFMALYFFKYDKYLFSSAWFTTLEKINAKDKMQWFTSAVEVEGQYAFINYLKHVTSSSSEISIYLYGVFQFLVLISIIYWFVYKISESTVIVPLFVCLFYILGFSFLPININYFFQCTSINLAFIIVFPTIYFYLYPKLLHKDNWNLFFTMATAFLAIGLIDIYMLFLVFPLFFVLSFFLYFNKFIKMKLIVIGAYLFSASLTLLLYFYYCHFDPAEFKVFVLSNLISVESDFHNPYLILFFDKLLFYYQLMFLVASVVIMIFAICFNYAWRRRILIMLFCSIIYLLTQFDLYFIDNDLLFRLLLIFLPIQLGILLNTILNFFKILFSTTTFTFYYRGLLVLVVVVLIFVNFELKPLQEHKDNKNRLNEEVLTVNLNILRYYYNLSYIVVNSDNLYMLSSYNRYFMGYKEFMSKEYLAKDALYAKHRDDDDYLKYNAEVVLSPSIIIYVYEDEYKGENEFSKKELLERINVFKNRGRKVRTIHSCQFFTVYEIINKPNLSLISEMVF